MTTVTLWLLIVMGYRNDNPQVLERFTTMAECERVKELLPRDHHWKRCIEARVAR